jgi:hypothetical protein
MDDIDAELRKLAAKALRKHPGDRLRCAMTFHDLVSQHKREAELDARMLQMLPNDWLRLLRGEPLREEPEGNA